jgi:hypothetical protein
MATKTRREFLADVGRGMFVASLGSSAAIELGLSRARAAERDGDDRLSFGKLEPLVSLMQETPPDRLLEILAQRLASGTALEEILAAGALANARVFGGEDYVGFHTMMALAPSYHMARELPPPRRPLPVLKVLYRNAKRLQEYGGEETLRQVPATALPAGRPCADDLRDAVRAKDVEKAERTFAAIAKESPDEAFNDLLQVVQDATEVHRVVLPYRAWDLLDLIGMDEAHALLRQSLRYCLRSEARGADPRFTESRSLLPKLLDTHRLLSRPRGERAGDDAWVAGMAETIFRSSGAEAADAVAGALAEGMAPEAVGEAISLAANQLILRDRGRTERESQPNKPPGSVHGDSIGVHACDSANAWRNMARVSNPRNTVASLILGAYQVAFDRVNRGGDFLNWEPHPLPAELEKVQEDDPEALLRALEGAIRENDQARAAALVGRYGERGHAPRPVFDMLLRYAVSEDGALHGEKYYRTVSEEFAATRPAFRWRQLVALARVTASEHGCAAPGYAEACRLLKVS